MTDQEYLNDILKSQDLKDDSQELKDLQTHRAEVEQTLRDGFPKCSPTIRYGGSKAKGTLIKEYYDLDIVCYFPSDDTTAGDTLEAIYNNVAGVLAKSYSVERKRSALRLRDTQKVDFHIDVVPGRFTDESKNDCFLHQENGDKERLKTNLQVHIDHVRDSGVLDAIRLLKLWKARKTLSVKQFAFELLIITLLDGHKKKSVADQVKLVWTELRDAAEAMTIVDPANPTGNDLTPLLSESWTELSMAAANALTTLENSGWEGIYGKLASGGDATAKMRVAAATVSTPSKPWSLRDGK